MGRREFIVLISMLMALTALAIDMMLPAFGDIRADFGLASDASDVALVVTVFFLGFGLGQPVWGPLSDALGRKRILWVGLAIYILAALGAAVAPSLTLLLAWRFLAGLGAAAVRVVTFGTVRDRYEGDEMAKTLSYVMAVFILVPMLAPSLGAVVLAVGTWRWVFAFFALAALLTAAWSLRLPETLPADRRIALRAKRLLAAGRAVLGSRFTMGLTLAQMLVFGFFASYLASTELIVDDVFGLAAWFPLIFGGSALAFGLGVLSNPRLIDRFGLRLMLRVALTGYLAAALLFAAIAVATGGHPPFWLYLVGILPLLLAHAFSMPNLNSAAMLPAGRIAGTAAAVVGAVATLGGALIGATIDASYDGGITPLAVAALILCALAFGCYRWSDAAWERAAHRELLPPEVQAAATAAAPIDVG